MEGIDRRRVLRLGAEAAVVSVVGGVMRATPASADPAVSSVPASVAADLSLDTGWYRKYVDAWGLAIVGSARVTDAALLKARSRLGTLLWTYPSWPVGELVRRRVRVVIIARGEKLSEIPEVKSAFGTQLDQRYWGGFGATDSFPLSTGTEANLIDGQGGEDVFVHEFAHTLHTMALQYVDLDFLPQLNAAWKVTVSAGRWRNTYARTNKYEYFAEGTQSYFDVNYPGPVRGDSVHNNVFNRVALRSYDPDLFRLLDRIYRGARLQRLSVDQGAAT